MMILLAVSLPAAKAEGALASSNAREAWSRRAWSECKAAMLAQVESSVADSS